MGILAKFAGSSLTTRTHADAIPAVAASRRQFLYGTGVGAVAVGIGAVGALTASPGHERPGLGAAAGEPTVRWECRGRLTAYEV